MRVVKIYIGLFFLLTAFSCSQNRESENLKLPSGSSNVLIEENAEEIIERKLIKVGRVEFEVEDIDLTRKNIFESVGKYKGYVSYDQEFKSPGRKSDTVVIRIPAQNFDDFLLDATKGVEKFESKKIKVNDVTEEFLDIEARLKTKKELENRYLDLLKQANNVTDILQIENEIGDLRSDIESIEGRLQYLQNKISLSTLTMIFYERVPNQTEFGHKFKDGIRNGWENLIWFFIALTNIWPFLLIGFGILFGLKIYKKRK